MEEKIQVNITIPKTWKEKLSSVARKKAAELDKDINYIDVIKLTLNEIYQLD